MMDKLFFKTGRALVATVLVAVGINSSLYADDTEIYQISGLNVWSSRGGRT